jgi:hypothetical protein
MRAVHAVGGVMIGLCATACGVVGLAGTPIVATAPAIGALVPPATGLALDGNAQLALGGGPVRSSRDDVDGGGAFMLRSFGNAGFASAGRIDLGTFGADRRFGWVGMDAGVGLRHRAVGGAVMAGYGYGGYARSGHGFPLRVAMHGARGPLAVRASAYVAWRITDEAAAPSERFGPAWRAWGVDASVGYGRPWGIAVGYSFDKMDAIGVHSVFFGGALRFEGRGR